MKAYVQDYQLVAPLPPAPLSAHGNSVSEKRLIFHAVKDHQRPVQVLDIGFGLGTLGSLIKAHPGTGHWQVDGIDGDAANCGNAALIERRCYRHIWHGFAQELSAERLASYDVLCLLDVIEHLDAPTARGLLCALLGALKEDGVLMLSTPLWFYPQDSLRPDDLEEHLIGVPASAMLALQPLAYAIGPALVGTFLYGRRSLDYADLFQPTADKAFSLERGIQVASACGMRLQPGVVFFTDAAQA